MADHTEVDLGAIPTWGIASASAARVGPRSDIRNCINRYHKDLKASARNKQEIVDESLKIHEELIKASGLHKDIFEEDAEEGITLFMPNDEAYGKIDQAKLNGLMSSKVNIPSAFVLKAQKHKSTLSLCHFIILRQNDKKST